MRCLIAVVLVMAMSVPTLAQTVPAPGVSGTPAPWPDTPQTREFRQRVLDLAVLYGESAGLDPNGYLIETTDLGPAKPGCRRVRARTSLSGVVVTTEEFEVCKPAAR